MLTHVSLFSGIGGFELAMAEAGIPTLAACEIDKKARGVLADRFPGTHIYHDVRKVTGDSLRTLGAVPRRTVLSAGWPCQGNSVAGSRGGMDDARSGLWSEVVRILAELRPAWFIGENVPGLLSVNGGADFATVVGDLAQLGYGFAWRVLDAQHFGVPQRRRRVVIVGRLGDSGRAPAQVLLEPESSSRNPAESITPRPIFARRTHAGTAGGFVPRIANTLCANSSQSLDSDLEDFVVGALGRHSHTLTAEGGSEDGTGRGTPIVVAPRLAATLTAGQAKPGVSAPGRRQEDDHNIVAFHMTQDPISGEVSPALGVTSGGMGVSYVASGCAECGHLDSAHRWYSRCMGTLSQPICICERTPSAAITYVAGIANALDTAQGGPDDNSAQAGHLVAVIAPTLRATNGSGGMAGNVGDLVLAGLAAGSTVVRRLTPLETCRLQGYPDGHTATSDGKPQADSAQYKQHGNGIAVPMFAWVAKRLAAVDGALT